MDEMNHTSSHPDFSSCIKPQSGPLFGHFQVQLDLTNTPIDLQSIQKVYVGGVAAYNLQVDEDGSLSFMVQGATKAGSALISVSTIEGEFNFCDLIYTPPIDPVFERVVAFGASLTQGVQRGVPSFHGTLVSPPALIARQAEAYFPMPLLVPDLFPEIIPDAIGPPPECTVPNITNYVTQRATDVIPLLMNDEERKFGYHFGRVDPDLSVYHLAVGGSNVGAMLDGPESGDLGGHFISHLVYDPYGEFLSPVEQSQLDVLESLNPTLILSADLFANDVVWAVLEGEVIDLELATDPDILVAHIYTIVERIAKTKAQVFLANLPRPSLLPATREKRKIMLAQGLDTNDIDALIESVDALATTGNLALEQAASEWDNVFVVDLITPTEALVDSGLTLSDEHLTINKFGGLLGLDGVHFSDTGYALVANTFIQTINDQLDLNIPLISLAEIMSHDRDSPASLRQTNLNSELCVD